MSVYHRSTAKGRILQEYRQREEEIAEELSRQMNQKGRLQGEKRMRREIANSNERRRMQSINAGFQRLLSLLPHNEGEKLSKAAILQQTTEYIHTLQQDNAKILTQNAIYKRLLNEVSQRCKIDFEADESLFSGSPSLKRKKRDTVESSDEGITADYFEDKNEVVRRETLEMRHKLDQEQQLNKVLEIHAVTQDFSQFKEKMHEIHQDVPKIKIVQNQDKTFHKEELNMEHSAPASRVPLHIPVHLDLEADHTVPSSPQHRCAGIEPKSSSMSRRNLETIVEAIRHLEGEEITSSDHVLSHPKEAIRHLEGEEKTSSDRVFLHPSVNKQTKHYIQHGEENENLCGISDQDDFRSESSGRESPSLQPHYSRLHRAQNLQHASLIKSSSTKVTESSSSYFSDRYPAVTNVLQGNPAQIQLYYRPEVIVQKS